MKPSESCRKCFTTLGQSTTDTSWHQSCQGMISWLSGAHWFHGRADFENYHSRLLSGLTLLQTEVRFLHPGMAVIHWSWKIDGDKKFDGTSRQRRFGMMTMVAQKRNGTWQVIETLCAVGKHTLLVNSADVQEATWEVLLWWLWCFSRDSAWALSHEAFGIRFRETIRVWGTWRPLKNSTKQSGSSSYAACSHSPRQCSLSFIRPRKSSSKNSAGTELPNQFNDK